jgi:hypothetical protein
MLLLLLSTTNDAVVVNHRRFSSSTTTHPTLLLLVDVVVVVGTTQFAALFGFFRYVDHPSFVLFLLRRRHGHPVGHGSMRRVYGRRGLE